MAKKLARFDNSKHPRGSKGRFVETPDPPGLAKARVYGTDNSSRKASRKRLSKSQEAKLDEIILARASKRDSLKASSGSQLSKARVYGSDTEARKLMLSRMNQAQKLRLLAAFDIADKQLVEAVAKAKASTDPTKRSRLSPEEKAAKEASKAEEKAAKEAEKQRKKDEQLRDKAQKADALAASVLAKDKKARKDIEDSLNSKLYSKVEPYTGAISYAIKAKDGKPVLPTAPTIRKPLKRSKVEIVDGSVEIWRDQEDLKKFTGNFKVKSEKGFKYGVEYEGRAVVLNQSQTMIEFEGERVHGVVSDHTKLRDFDNQRVVSRMLTAMQYVEDYTDRKTKPPAIKWVETYHGKIDKDVLLLNGKDGLYGGVEIHHMDQWSLRRFDDITNKLKYNEKTKLFEDGAISVEEAKKQMSDLVEWVYDKTPSGKTEWQWRIKLAPQDQRELVLLPAGAHNATSKKLYSLLHPPGVHPDTGKKAEFGIPISSDPNGRDWFNGWNARFWREYYRREAYIMRQEVNRRLKKGELDVGQFGGMVEVARKKQASEFTWQVSESAISQGKRKVIMQDFLGDRSSWNHKYKE